MHIPRSAWKAFLQSKAAVKTKARGTSLIDSRYGALKPSERNQEGLWSLYLIGVIIWYGTWPKNRRFEVRAPNLGPYLFLPCLGGVASMGLILTWYVMGIGGFQVRGPRGRFMVSCSTARFSGPSTPRPSQRYE